MPHLEVVRAGAGSGKTTDLCQTVADAVAAGLDPSRILATTFTKKAAAELKSRIQAKLLAGGIGVHQAHHHADRLELAAIGTVHSVAHQLLRRYAIELGLSPRLEVIEEAGSDSALRESLSAIPTDSWRKLIELAQRLDIDELHKRFLQLLAIKRGNRISDDDFLLHMTESAECVCHLLAPDGPVKVAPPAERLGELVAEALAGLEALTSDTQSNTNAARQKLRQLRARRTLVWGSYLEALGIQAGKRTGADDLLGTLRSHAGSVRRDPRLHADIREFSSLLAHETVRLEQRYMADKRERGLVDFTDLEVMLLDLLNDGPLSQQLARDYDLALVDEFQDTSPLQLAIFQRLRCLLPRSRWVGDPKQAIYGFRDTDPSMVNAIWETAASHERMSLPDNHRSQRGLVQLIGALFTPVLGDSARQNPVREGAPRGIERWIFESNKQADDAVALACGIARLRKEGTPYGDIAVLARTNGGLAELAAALESLGIPYLLESPGLFATREGAMLLAGLRLVADRNDSLAAATIIHVLSDPDQPTPAWIDQRLNALRQIRGSGQADASAATRFQLPWEGDTRLSPLERIDRSVLSPSAVMQEVIEALELPGRIPAWGTPANRFANLDSALEHAREYEEQALRGGQAATLSGLILHLEQLAGQRLDMRFTSQGHDAVTLMTYHGAKGLEWPVVVLATLHFKRPPDMWQPTVSGGAVDHDNPLLGRRLRCWIWPFGQAGGPSDRLRTGSGLEVEALSCADGVERTSRDTEESMRLLYVGCTRAKEKLVFAHREGQYDWLSQLPEVDAILDPARAAGETVLEGIETTYVLRRLSAEQAEACRTATEGRTRWVAAPPPTSPSEQLDRFHSPSANASAELIADSGARGADFELVQLGGQPFFPSNLDGSQTMAIGHAVHAYLAAMPSLGRVDAATRAKVAERTIAAYSVGGLVPPTILVAAGERFQQWVNSMFSQATWHTEVPISGSRTLGGKWVGSADLLLQLARGEIVLVDHKSAPIRQQQCAAKAAEYSGQLSAYSEVLIGAGARLHSAWIHFPLAGVVLRCRYDT